MPVSTLVKKQSDESDWFSSQQSSPQHNTTSKKKKMSASVSRTQRSGSGSGRKKAPYVSRACNTCRRRKSRCDGSRPTCSGCQRLGHECGYDDTPDNRRPATKSYVESLRNHIRTLVDRVSELEAQQGVPAPSGALNFDYETLLTGSPYPDSSEESQSETDMESLTETSRMMSLRDDLYTTSPFNTLSPEQLPSPITSYDGRAHQLCLPQHYMEGIPPHYESSGCVNFDKYLPADVSITRYQHDLLLDRFFKFFSSWCYRAIPELFLRDMYVCLSFVGDDSAAPRTQHYNGMLHNAIMAVATAFADDPSLKSRACREKFAAKAKTFIEQECQTPTLAVVQALGILASYHSGIGDQSLGFLYFGMSVRMTQALGLSADSSSWLQRADVEERNWAYWMTYAQDKCWSIYVGRDVSVPIPRIRLPRVHQSLDMVPWSWHEANLPTQSSYVSSTFLESIKLLQLGNRIMDLIYASGRDVRGVDQRMITALLVELDAWVEHLPPPLRILVIPTTTAPPHIIMMHLAFHWLVILLCRPFSRPPSRSNPSPLSSPAIQQEIARKRCERASTKIVQFLHVWKNLYGLRFVPITPIQVAFAAGTTFLLAAVQSGTSAPRMKETAMTGVEECVGFLKEMGASWEAGTQNAQILEKLIAEQIALSPVPSRQPSMQVSRQNTVLPPIAGRMGTLPGRVLPQRTSSMIPVGPALKRVEAQSILGPLDPDGPTTFTEDPIDIDEIFNWEQIVEEPGPSVWYPQLEAVLNQPAMMGMRGGEAFPSQPWVSLGQGGLYIGTEEDSIHLGHNQWLHVGGDHGA